MKICLWGNIASALSGNTDGGGELQLALLAKALARGGHEVVIIDCNTTKDFITADGIKVFKIKGWNNGIRIIRTFTHRLPQLYWSLKAQKADVYYCRIRDFRHILAFWAARKVKAKFVLGLASDLDAMNFATRFKYQHLVSPSGLWAFFSGFLIEIVYPWLLQNADLVLVQHEGQKNILLKKRIKSLVFPNLFDLTETPIIPDHSHKDFIYVGDLNKRKGFAEFFEIVKKAPLHSYKVVGQPQDKTGYLYYKKLKSCENVSLLGRLNHSDTMYQIANSKALISTSPMEGFPNVFLEAWAAGVPVISLKVNPGNVIDKYNLGICCSGDLNKMKKSIEFYGPSNIDKEKLISYVSEFHDFTTAADRFLNIINNS